MDWTILYIFIFTFPWVIYYGSWKKTLVRDSDKLTHRRKIIAISYMILVFADLSLKFYFFEIWSTIAILLIGVFLMLWAILTNKNNA